ncbi:MAG TPA: hypothetical protein VI540_07255 [Gaiellaceae bacterium]|nr:hypothetical protein [Gaiellaceae bacterium]
MGSRKRTLVAVAAVVLAAAPAATAGAPVILTPSALVVTGSDYGSCAQGFDVTADFVLERRLVNFLEGDELVKQVRHVRWEGTLNGNGHSVTYGGTVTFTFDFLAGTLTKTGRFRYSKPDGGGLAVQDAGRTVESLETGVIESDTAGTIEKFDSAICAALAG